MTRDALPGDPSDAQARYIEAAVEGVLVGCLYAPNGNPQPGPKFDYKLAWHARFEAHAAELLAAGVPVVLAGDYNIVPEPRDIYPTTSYDGNALIQPESRAAYGGCWTRAGPTRSARCIRTGRSIPSGTTGGCAGSAMGACGSTISCSAPSSPGDCATRASTAPCAGARTPATTRRSGSSSPPPPPPLKHAYGLCMPCACPVHGRFRVTH